MPRYVYAACAAVVLLALVGPSHAQTTSASGQSLELSGRADELAGAGQPARAAQIYRRAIELDETNLRAHLGLSRALLLLGRHDDALEALRDAEAVLGWRTELAIQRADHLVRLERWSDALAELDRVPDDDTLSYLADRTRAAAYLRLTQWEAAIAAYERYLRSRPAALAASDAYVRTRLAFALIQHGDYTNARRVLGEALTAEPRRLSARVLLFTALAKEGRCDDALRLWDEIERAVPSVPTLLYDAAVCHYRLGDERRALALLDDYRARWRLPGQALLLTARIHVALGDVARAEESYRAAIDAGVPAQVELARWWIKRGEHQAAARLLAPLAEAGAEDPELLYLAALALQRIGELDRAAAVCARVVERLPELRSWLLEGEIQLARAQWEAAERAFLRAIAAADSPDERATAGLRQALERRAHLAFRAGDREDARALLTRAYAADPSADRVAYDLALLELERGDAARAVALLEGRSSRLSDPAKGHLVLGTALARLGDTARARAELEAVIESDTASDPLRARALATLAPLLARTAPARAVELAARARELGVGDDAAATLASATAAAHLSLAERAYERDETRELRAHLRRIEASALSPTARVRLGVLQAIAEGRNKGIARAMRRLASIPDTDLAQAARDGLPARVLRHALELQLGSRLLTRASDYRRHLAAPAAALRRAEAEGSRVAGQVLTVAYGRLLEWVMQSPNPGLARALAKDLPAMARSPELEHNAIIATSLTRRGHTDFTSAQIGQLERLAAELPTALVNLAIDAEQRGDHAAALRYLERVPADASNPAIREWVRWKEQLYGAP